MMSGKTLELLLMDREPPVRRGADTFGDELEAFREFGKPTRRISTAFQTAAGPLEAPTFVNEFWTAKQRAASRLHEISYRACLQSSEEFPADLLVFYHPETLKEITSLKKYLLDRRENNEVDPVDDLICLMALNRLTGHSPGFFFVYTLPPNQAVSVKSQQKINAQRNQTPPRRKVPELILKKPGFC